MRGPILRITEARQIGNAFRTLRIHQDVSQTDIANATGAFLTQYTAWEKGRVIPGLIRTLDVLTACGYEVLLVPKGFTCGA